MIKLILVAMLLAGCDTRARYEDASAETRSMEVIGVRYEVVGPVQAHGFRQHSQAAVERVLLMPPPGVEGPEIGFRVPVRQGSTVTVRKVVRTNRWIGNKMDLEVNLEGTTLPVTAPVSIGLIRGNERDGSLQRNPSFYRRLP